MYGVNEQVMSSPPPSSSSSSAHPSSFLYKLSVLKDRVHQVQSLATIFLSPDHGHTPESMVIAIPTMGTLIQEIIVTASSMMFSCQQMAIAHTNTVEEKQQQGNDAAGGGGDPLDQPAGDGEDSNGFFSNQNEMLEQWYGDHYNNCSSNEEDNPGIELNCQDKTEPPEQQQHPINNSDIIELEAADLLAKYTHYCNICGKGFKRDANLRMHMRAHGDEYKSTAALSNPMKKNKLNSIGEDAAASAAGNPKPLHKYSCPHEGCRWNKNHAKFQPLKSMICVKNHYKRSHCPKMYVCKRCSRKQFSVLSDLKTHEKHCGDLKWQCSCGTTFSRKDKLMGHVALFVGHSPAGSCSAKIGNGMTNSGHMESGDGRR